MIGESKSKYITLTLLLFIFFAFCFQNISAQEIKVGPPGPEQARSFWNDMASTTKSVFQNIKKIGQGFSFFAPFFQNTAGKIGNWWSFNAQPWISGQWNCLINYLDQEIRIE